MKTKVYAVFLPEVRVIQMGKHSRMLSRKCIGWARVRKVKQAKP